MRTLEQVLVAHAASAPIGFDEFQANALYAPELGFYTGGGGAGRRRDFLTSPEVGPLFGAIIARALDTWWDELGQPDPYVVIEAGAGPGTLARTVLAAEPRCAPALQLVLVEVGETQWQTHPAGVISRADLPHPGEYRGQPLVVLANELLDNLPVALVERTESGWTEVVVAAGDGRLEEAHRSLPPTQEAWCEARAPEAPFGARMPVQSDAAAWTRSALDLAGSGGVVVAIDYARSSPEMAELRWDAWLRTYAKHGRGTHPLDAPGSQDITCDVALDQLALVAPPARVTSQADFLRTHGIDELVADGREVWAELGPAGGVRAIAAQSRIPESQALLDPDGLGGFTVIEWRP